MLLFNITERLFLSSSSCISVCLLEAFGCPLSANPFFSFRGESRGSMPSSWIMHERERSWISNSMLSLGLTCPSYLDCFGPPFPHLENGTDVYLVGLCLEALIFLLVVLANDNVAALPERRGCGCMFWVSVSFAKYAWC